MKHEIPTSTLTDTSDAPDIYELPEGIAFYKPKSPNDPGPASAGEARGEILRLGQKVTDRIGHAVSTDDPEYWGLACFVTPQMAKVANKMKVRVPYRLEELERMTRMEKDELEPLLHEMSVVGLLEYNWENDDRQKQWVLPLFVPGSAEFCVMNQKQIEEHPELGTFFERMTRLPLEVPTPMVPPGGAGIGMHVIPVEHAIDVKNESIDIEHISYWLDKYPDQYSIGACSCRLSESLRGDGCGDDPQDWCIGVGDMARYCVETNKGRYASREEVLEILQRAEDNGFVHQITNIDGSGKIFAICNCNVNVCYALRTSQLFNTPNLSRSAYVAEVDAEKCVACGGCVEVCPAGAPQLGQKIPLAHGSIEYPTQELPDEASWGKGKWDEDYKNNNRIECHDTGTAPCKAACPAHISVQGYLRMAAEGRYTEALALIKQENPFPAVCGRVCNKRCETACTRGTVDEAVAIDDVKRFIADRDLDAATRFVPNKVIPSLRGGFDDKVAIIGAGPAGLTCAYYLALKGYAPTVFERDPLPGGMLRYGIPSYKLQKDVIDAEIDIMRELGVEIRCGIDVGTDVTLDELREQGYGAFYLAIGCQGGRSAGIDGEKGEGVMSAVSFLHAAAETLGAGEEPTLDGHVVVVGGGNVAVDAARTAHREGASEVTMVCLEQPEQMPATPLEVDETTGDGIAIKNGWGPAEVRRDEDGSVCGITFKRCTSVFDDEGRFSPAYDETDTMDIDCEHVIMAIGQTIEWGGLLDGSTVELGRGQCAVVDAQTFQTAQADVFAGGDVVTGPSFVIDAIAQGHEAAISIHRFLRKGSSLTIGRNPRHYVELDTSNVAPVSYDTAGRQRPGWDADVDEHRSWTDGHLALTEEQIKAECARCLKCGASIVDANSCIGCGLCTTRCEFDAIHLVRSRPECSTMVRSEDKFKVIGPYAAKRAVKIVKKKLAGKA